MLLYVHFIYYVKLKNAAFKKLHFSHQFISGVSTICRAVCLLQLVARDDVGAPLHRVPDEAAGARDGGGEGEGEDEDKYRGRFHFSTSRLSQNLKFKC
jgi:hypothetical protein